MLSNKFSEALEYATNLHRGHVRKGTEIPYVCHLLSVCGLVLEYEGDERTAIAALLHDALEDHWRGAQTQEEIRDRFGEEVLTVVLDCSETGEHTSGNWRERKERYIEHLRYASHPALLVSA